MKKTLWLTAIAVTVFALSLDAVAQPGQRGQGQGPGQTQRGQGQQPGMGFGAVQAPQQLLRNEEVAKSLELTEAQQTALNEALRPAGRAGAGQGQQSAPGGQRTPPTPAEQAQRTADTWKAIHEVLNEAQQTKFKEIYFQVNNGLNSPALDDWLLAAVDLTADQKEKIAKLAADRAAEARAATPPGQDATQEERVAWRTAAQERSTKYGDQIKALLTAEQKEKAEKLTEGAGELRRSLGIGQRQPGGGAQPGAGGRGAGAGGTFVPGDNSWRPGQGAPAGGAGGNRPAGGNRRTGGGN